MAEVVPRLAGLQLPLHKIQRRVLLRRLRRASEPRRRPIRRSRAWRFPSRVALRCCPSGHRLNRVSKVLRTCPEDVQETIGREPALYWQSQYPVAPHQQGAHTRRQRGCGPRRQKRAPARVASCQRFHPKVASHLRCGLAARGCLPTSRAP